MRKICVITTTRAEYGIFSGLIKRLEAESDIELALVASGTHVSVRHGMTVTEIEADGIPVTCRVDIGLDKFPDGAVELVMSNALSSFVHVLRDLGPDIVVLLGDRFEIMAAAMACTLCNIPIAHLHGGEATEGAMDEVFRHSITKASHLHFTSCEVYRQRVIQLGEAPERVFNVGALSVENIRTVPLMTKDELEYSLGLRFLARMLLVTFHPVSFSPGQAEKQVTELLAALGTLKKTSVIITRPNADPEYSVINVQIDAFTANHNFAHAFQSLGMRRYLSAMSFADAVVGNSSSGIIEAPSFGCATINIGDRQKGRIQATSVINCLPERHDILRALRKVESPEFKNLLQVCVNPYEGNNTTESILRVLKEYPLQGIMKKHFYEVR